MDSNKNTALIKHQHQTLAKVSNQLSITDKLLSKKRIEKLLELARGYYEKREYEKVIELTTKVIEINPEYLSAYFYRGCAYSKSGY